MARGIYVLTKLPHKVNGVGFTCSVKIIEQKCKSSWFNIKEPCTYKHYYKDLTRGACDIMIKSQECEGNKMTCIGDTCHYDSTPTQRYLWAVETTSIGYVCTLTKIKIVANAIDNKLFKSNCTAKDLSCKTDKSITVWAENIIHTCGYHMLDKTRTLSMSRIDFLVDDRNSWVFSIVEKFNDCKTESRPGMYIYKSREGLYLTSSPKALDLKYEEYSQNNMNSIILADIDSHFNKNQELAFYLRQKQCETTFALLRSISYKDESYLKWHDSNNRATIFFVKQNLVFLPKCRKVDSVFLRNNEKQCFNDIPVKLSNRKNLFLGHDNILRRKSSIADCNDFERIFHISESNEFLLYNGMNKFSYLRTHHTLTADIFFNSITKFDYSHYPLLTNESIREESSQVEIGDSTVFDDKGSLITNENNTNSVLTPNLDVIHHAYKSIKNWITDLVKSVIIICTVILIILIIIYVSYSGCIKCILNRLTDFNKKLINIRKDKKESIVLRELKTIPNKIYQSNQKINEKFNENESHWLVK
jgi:hypothetical protein